MILALSLPISYARAGNFCTDKTVQVDPSDPSKKTVCAEKGDKAPFDGITMTPELAGELAASQDYVKKRIKAAVSSSVALERAKMEYALDLKEIEIDAGKAREEALKRKIKEVEPDWYEKPVVVVILTIVGIAALGVGAGVAVNAAK